MDEAHIFFWGTFGSLAADVWRFRRVSCTSAIRLPAPYRHVRFYVGALLTALTAGGLAYALGADKPWLAFQVGVSAPLILEKLSQVPPRLPPAKPEE